jgi:hypothetical protein
MMQYVEPLLHVQLLVNRLIKVLIIPLFTIYPTRYIVNNGIVYYNMSKWGTEMNTKEAVATRIIELCQKKILPLMH